MRLGRLPRIPTALAVVSAVGCAVAATDLTGKACPCVEGWTCRSGVCVAGSDPGGPGSATTPPSFQLAVPPALTIAEGTTAALSVTVQGAGDGPINVGVELPAGLFASPGQLVLSKAEPTKAFTLTASADRLPGLVTATVTGSGGTGGDARVPLAITVIGRPGTLDITFGVGGIVLPAARTAKALALRDAGSLLFGGEQWASQGPFVNTPRTCVVSQVEADGATDPSFMQPLLTSDDAGCFLQDVVSSPDGRGAVLSAKGSDLIVFASRLRADGTVDPTFGDAGRANASSPLYDEGFGRIASTPDGHVLVGGFIFNKGVIVRYDARGVLDPGFGSGGIAQAGIEHLKSFALAPDGKVVLVGFDESHLSRLGRLGSL